MTYLSWDTETALISPRYPAPPLACLTWYDGAGAFDLLDTASDGPRVWLASALASGVPVVGHNVAYDAAVMGVEYPDLVRPLFAAVADGRLRDTMVRAQLLDIAMGQFRGRFAADSDEWIKITYHLEDCARRYAGMQIKKDGFRLHYDGFRGVPKAQWAVRALEIQSAARPRLDHLRSLSAKSLTKVTKAELKDLEGLVAAPPHEATSYPIEDAVATGRVYEAQERVRRAFQDAVGVDPLADERRAGRSAWALHLASVWGLRTDRAAVDELERLTLASHGDVRVQLETAGLVRGPASKGKDGSRDTKAAAALMRRVCQVTGARVRRTKTAAEKMKAGIVVPDEEGIALDADACKAAALACAEHGQEVVALGSTLQAYAEYTSLNAVLSKDVKALRSGDYYPVHTRFGIAESGRSTSSGPNVQNWRQLIGIRECFRPRPGHVFIVTDFDQLELRTLAQVCLTMFGKSRLAEVLNSGRDPHTELAATLYGCTYEAGDAFKIANDNDRWNHARRLAKEANFGLPGGMGIAKFIQRAEKNGVRLTVERATELKVAWLVTWPELKSYFAMVRDLTKGDDGGMIVQLGSRRVRGRCKYTEAANGWFQGLGADAAKAALWAVSSACYLDAASPLFGSRPVNFIHDEIITETRECETMHEAAQEHARLMRVGADEFLPDVPARAEAYLMRFWSKKAKAVRRHGRLIPWPDAA